MPMIGNCGWHSRNSAMPAAVAVLQASTSALAPPCSRRKSVMVRQRSRMNSGLFSP